MTLADDGTLAPYDDNLANWGNNLSMRHPAKRLRAGTFVNYEINEHAKAYFEANFMRAENRNYYDETATFGMPATIRCDSPILSPAQAAQICGAGRFESAVHRLVHRQPVQAQRRRRGALLGQGVQLLPRRHRREGRYHVELALRRVVPLRQHHQLRAGHECVRAQPGVERGQPHSQRQRRHRVRLRRRVPAVYGLHAGRHHAGRARLSDQRSLHRWRCEHVCHERLRGGRPAVDDSVGGQSDRVGARYRISQGNIRHVLRRLRRSRATSSVARVSRTPRARTT